MKNAVDHSQHAVPEGRQTTMNQFTGQSLSWDVKDGVIELSLHRAPCNEIGSRTLGELEKFVGALAGLVAEGHVGRRSGSRTHGEAAGATRAALLPS